MSTALTYVCSKVLKHLISISHGKSKKAWNSLWLPTRLKDGLLTEIQLLQVVHKFSDSFQNSKQVGGILLDLSHSFDVVPLGLEHRKKQENINILHKDDLNFAI